MKYDDLAMTDKELVELGEATLHGTPPFKTILRMYHGAMRLMGERDNIVKAAQAVLETSEKLDSHGLYRAVDKEALEALRALVPPDDSNALKVKADSAVPPGEIQLRAPDGSVAARIVGIDAIKDFDGD